MGFTSVSVCVFFVLVELMNDRQTEHQTANILQTANNCDLVSLRLYRHGKQRVMKT